MKKNIKSFFAIFLILTFTLVFFKKAIAQSPTPTLNTPASPSINEDQIERIKDIVASRVAELNLVEKKGIFGKVTSKVSTQITLESINGNKRIIEIDELTKFKDPKNNNFGISDIKEGNLVGVIGLLNKAADRILARQVGTVASIPEYFDGIVSGIDTKNFQINAIDENGIKIKIDITTSTKTSSYNAKKGTVKSGFSKIEVGQRIYAVGFMDQRIKDQLNASRVIHFLDIMPSEKMKSFLNSLEE